VPGQNQRIAQVENQMQRDISEIFVRQIADPRLTDVSITGVDVTGDLSMATIYYVINSESASDYQKVQTGLTAAKGLIKKELASKMTTFRVPDLKFEQDKSVEYGNRIDQLINDLNKKI
jgi:ribosome-binding factor A